MLLHLSLEQLLGLECCLYAWVIIMCEAEAGGSLCCINIRLVRVLYALGVESCFLSCRVSSDSSMVQDDEHGYSYFSFLLLPGYLIRWLLKSLLVFKLRIAWFPVWALSKVHFLLLCGCDENIVVASIALSDMYARMLTLCVPSTGCFHSSLRSCICCALQRMVLKISICFMSLELVNSLH